MSGISSKKPQPIQEWKLIACGNTIHVYTATEDSRKWLEDELKQYGMYFARSHGFNYDQLHVSPLYKQAEIIEYYNALAQEPSELPEE